MSAFRSLLPRLALALLVLPLLLAACGSAGGPSQPGGGVGSSHGTNGGDPGATGPSGVSGRTIIGPTCPVENPASPCPPQPISALIEVRRPGADAIVAHTVSADDGRFRVVLAPGQYVVTAKVAVPAALPHPNKVTVTVNPHQFTQVKITLDSGIRRPVATP